MTETIKQHTETEVTVDHVEHTARPIAKPPGWREVVQHREVLAWCSYKSLLPIFTTITSNPLQSRPAHLPSTHELWI
jgi:hypothetical protein